MKVMVLCPTLWSQMMADCWQQVPNVEVMAELVPVAGFTPESRLQFARDLVRYVQLKSPDFIVDINASALLPLDKAGTEWTAAAIGKRWVEWWWDDPASYVGALRSAGHLEGWCNCLHAENLRHCFWDPTLAREYTRWFGRTCRTLPTAVHSRAFSPEAAATTAPFPPADVCFLGTFYEPGAPTGLPDAELSVLCTERLLHPERDYFSLARSQRDALPEFNAVLNHCRAMPHGWATPEYLQWRHQANVRVGEKRRTLPLQEMLTFNLSRTLAGNGWAANTPGLSRNIYNPAELAWLYRNTTCCLELGNGQSFSGVTMRTFEILSCGGILATLQPPGFDPQGTRSGELYWLLESIGQLPELAKRCRHEPQRVATMRAAARDFVLQGHDWLHRLGEFGAILGE